MTYLLIVNMTLLFTLLGVLLRQQKTGLDAQRIIDKLDKAAVHADTAAELLKTSVEVARMLSIADREIARSSNEAVLRIEAQAAGVADDLAATHQRANESDGPHGAAADAAMKTEL